jgi:hypothetical protein
VECANISQIDKSVYLFFWPIAPTPESRTHAPVDRGPGTLLYRATVEGLANFPTSGPRLALVKHQRNEDIPLGFSYVLAARRPDNWCIMNGIVAVAIWSIRRLDLTIACAAIYG